MKITHQTQPHKASPAPAYMLTSPRFTYVPSHATDIRKTFERIRNQAAWATRSPLGKAFLSLSPLSCSTRRHLGGVFHTQLRHGLTEVCERKKTFKRVYYIVCTI